jgi:drug/metabolite transporter (DMT)-like permease
MSDFVGAIASRHVSSLRVVLVSYPIALVLLAGLAVVVGGDITAPAVWWGIGYGVLQAFGIWWLYAALAAGPISVVSPLTAVLVAGIPVGVGLLQGERPGALAAVGVVLALIAVVLVSREASEEDGQPHRFTPRVAWLTVGSGVAFGLNFVAIHEAPVEAKLWPLVVGRITAVAMVVVIAALSGNLRPPTGAPLKLAVVAALLDTGGAIATLLALQSSMLSLAGVLISLYPAATVLLAIIVLRERVTVWQSAGMVLALASIGMITSG